MDFVYTLRADGQADKQNGLNRSKTGYFGVEKTQKKTYNRVIVSLSLLRGWDPHLMAFRKYSRLLSLRYTQLSTLLIFVTHFVKKPHRGFFTRSPPSYEPRSHNRRDHGAQVYLHNKQKRSLTTSFCLLRGWDLNLMTSGL